MKRIILALTFCIFALSSFSQVNILNGSISLQKITEEFTSSSSYEIFTYTTLDSIQKYTIFDHDLNIVEEFSYLLPEIKYHYANYPESEYTSYPLSIMYIHNYDTDGAYELPAYYLTKDFWGNNNEYECCVPTTCNDSIQRGSNIYTQVINGFKIMGHKGSTLFQLTYPKGYYSPYSFPTYFYIIDNKIKCLVYVYDTNGNQYTLIYDITKQMSVESTNANYQLVSIRPTLLSQSEPVNIEFESTSNKEKLIEVYSTSGQIAYSTKVTGECSNISIPSIYFPKGINIVKISENGKQIHTTKIIVR